MNATPWHPLADVKALVAANKFDLAVTSAARRILPHLRLATFGAVRVFAAGVVAQLRAGDFAHHVVLRGADGRSNVVHDVYATRIDAGLARAHLDGEHKRTWYVKLTIVRAPRTVFLISLHCLEVPMKRADRTTLSPCWKESE